MFFFGTHDFGWVNQTSIYLYLKGDGEWKNNNEKERLKNSIDEAEQWMQRFNEIIEKSGKPNMRKNKPPPYKKLKANRVIAKFTDCMEYNECACRPDDPAPCSLESNCYNAVLNFECDPKLCPARGKCQNQNFLRGEQYPFQVKMTDSKGWGLYAVEEIPVDKFVVEYMGEVIDNVEFDQRFSRATANKDDNYYFLTLGKNLYIDAAIYGNKARFINHSCDPNVVPNKWTVYSSGQEQIRIGFFAARNILPVRMMDAFALQGNAMQCNPIQFINYFIMCLIAGRGNHIRLQLGQNEEHEDCLPMWLEEVSRSHLIAAILIAFIVKIFISFFSPKLNFLVYILDFK